MKHISHAINEHKEFVDKILADKSPGWLTPYKYLNNELMPGFPYNTITTLAGFSGVGKTAFLLNMLYAAPILNKMKCYMFSLEMPARALIARRHSAKTGKQIKDLIKEEVDLTLFDDIAQLPIYFIEEAPKPEHFYSIVDQLCKEDPTTNILIAVDHSLLLDYAGNNTDNDKIQIIADTMNRLKIKHKNFNGLILSQLNDAMMKEERLKKSGIQMFPMYNDLMNGRKLYQISDTVIVLNEPSNYVEKTFIKSLINKEYGGVYPLKYYDNDVIRSIIYGHIIKGRDTGGAVIAFGNNLKNNEFIDLDIKKIIT
jgi:replicative DNA helicase